MLQFTTILHSSGGIFVPVIYVAASGCDNHFKPKNSDFKELNPNFKEFDSGFDELL